MIKERIVEGKTLLVYLKIIINALEMNGKIFNFGIRILELIYPILHEHPTFC